MEPVNTPHDDTNPQSDFSSDLEIKKSVILDPNEDKNIVTAGEIIRNKGLVSFPTETVYGLGANALDPEAATLIFTTKERPMTDPLIVHVAEKTDAYELISKDENIREIFDILGDRFWPGPLTLVVEANQEKISPIITASTGYVGIRCPNNPIALKLIKEAGRPIAAPSANKFGHVSPTKAEHVFNDFQNDGVHILDGGPCNFGIESTVVKIYYNETSTPQEKHINLLILRRGGISESEFRKAVSEIDIPETILTVDCVQRKHFTEESHKMEAPGQFLRHYAPNLPSYMLSSKEIGESDETSPLHLEKCVLLDFNAMNNKLKDKVSLYLDMSPKGDYVEAINHVYDYLRISETQEKGEMVIIANLLDSSSTNDSETSHSEHSSALFDRLFRAVTGSCIMVDDDFSNYSISKL